MVDFHHCIPHNEVRVKESTRIVAFVDTQIPKHPATKVKGRTCGCYDETYSENVQK